MNTIQVGLRIKSIRGAATQKEFAERLGVARTSLARYEAGENAPDAEFLLKAYTVCQIEPLWLLTGITSQQSPLTLDEQMLVARFRSGSQELRDAALRVLLGASEKTYDITGTGNRVAYGTYNEYKDNDGTPDKR